MSYFYNVTRKHMYLTLYVHSLIFYIMKIRKSSKNLTEIDLIDEFMEDLHRDMWHTFVYI